MQGGDEKAPGSKVARQSRVGKGSAWLRSGLRRAQGLLRLAAAHGPLSSHRRSQNANFQNPRCENTPLIGRESPPPSVSVRAGGGRAGLGGALWPPESVVALTGSAGPGGRL